MDKELELALAQIEKQYGKGTIIDNTGFAIEGIEVLPTGNFEIDDILGVGGLPTGRITEIYGQEAVGKSLLALTLTAEAQKAGHKVLYVDAECDLDHTWAKKMGVDMEQLMICQPDHGEQGLDVARTLIKTGAVKLIIIDSVAAMTPKSIIDGEVGDAHVAALPRMFAQTMGMLRAEVKKNDVCLVLLNQIRDKIGFMKSGTESPGGRAIKFYSSIRIELKRIGDYREGNEVVGTKVKAFTKKNKVASPHRETVYNVIDGYGFDNLTPMLEEAVELKILQKGGSWIYYRVVDPETGEFVKGSAVGNGAKQWRQHFEENPDKLEEIKQQVKEKRDNG